MQDPQSLSESAGWVAGADSLRGQKRGSTWEGQRQLLCIPVAVCVGNGGSSEVDVHQGPEGMQEVEAECSEGQLPWP